MTPEPAVRTALITGASRGIGLEVARALASDGLRVAMLARGETALREAAASVGELARPVVCDVRDAEAVERALRDVRAAFGEVPDVIVNNAGLFHLATVEETTIADFRGALDVNLVAPFLIVRAVLPEMRRRGSGHIVTIGSIADRVAFPANGAYAASKFGGRAFHQVLRAELRGSGVRASLVSPGPVDTAIWDEIDPDSRPGFTPRREMLSAAAVAGAVRWIVRQPPDVNVDELRLSHT